MAFEDKMRQQEEESKRIEEQQQRNLNLQYAAIALVLVSFLILFFAFSHTIIANQRVIRFLGVIALLIVFEFLNLLLHPWLGAVTHHSPVLMLLAMVCVAALLIPLHHRVEHWITHRLVEKNKKIRLSAAKRVVAELEPGATA
jgi:NADH:ubiquinone oxidoreductase subunit 3 (subunit A)